MSDTDPLRDALAEWIAIAYNDWEGSTDSGMTMEEYIAARLRAAGVTAPAQPALVCGVCLYAVEGVAAPAITIIEGYAVCEDHAGVVAQGMNFYNIRKAATR